MDDIAVYCSIIIISMSCSRIFESKTKDAPNIYTVPMRVGRHYIFTRRVNLSKNIYYCLGYCCRNWEVYWRVNTPYYPPISGIKSFGIIGRRIRSRYYSGTSTGWLTWTVVRAAVCTTSATLRRCQPAVLFPYVLCCISYYNSGCTVQRDRLDPIATSTSVIHHNIIGVRVMYGVLACPRTKTALVQRAFTTC